MAGEISLAGLLRFLTATATSRCGLFPVICGTLPATTLPWMHQQRRRALSFLLPPFPSAFRALSACSRLHQRERRAAVSTAR